MKTKTAIINEIQTSPEWFEELQDECKRIQQDTGITVDPLDLGLIMAVYNDRLGMPLVRNDYYNDDCQKILDKAQNLPLIKTVMKRYPVLVLDLLTMVDPWDADHEIAYGLDMIKKQ